MIHVLYRLFCMCVSYVVSLLYFTIYVCMTCRFCYWPSGCWLDTFAKI